MSDRTQTDKERGWCVIKNRTVKIAALLLPLIIAALLPLTCSAAKNAGDGVILTIIHTNDKHGRMTAEPYISGLAGKTAGNVLILDAGDTLHGQTAANLSKGEAMVELMNEVGYSAMTAGNHDFSYGIERLTELSEMMSFPLLAANVKTADGKPLLEAYKVFRMDGVTVGVFGLATPKTVEASDPRIMSGLRFENPAKTAETMVNTLKDEGCDIVVALAHMGINAQSAAAGGGALARVAGVDIIIDGHSHEKLDEGLLIGDTLIAQTGEYGQNIGVVEVAVSGGNVSKTARLIAVPEPGEATELTADERILSKIAELEAENEAITSFVVGHTPVLLMGDKEIIRTQETNLANLITDAFRHASGADISFLTGGNIRASIPAGDITLGHVLTTLPYSNLLVTTELTGAEILSVLEHGVSLYPEPAGQYIQVSGINFEFDPAAEPLHRVKAVMLANGDTLDIDKAYTVATTDFIAAGGDGYSMLSNAEKIVYYGVDAEAFASYLATASDISSEPEGRVKAVTAHDTQSEAISPAKPEADAGYSFGFIFAAAISVILIAVILFMLAKRMAGAKQK